MLFTYCEKTNLATFVARLGKMPTAAWQSNKIQDYFMFIYNHGIAQVR